MLISQLIKDKNYIILILLPFQEEIQISKLILILVEELILVLNQ